MSSHKVFISFSSKDKKLAERVYDHLSNNGITCWISSRDIPPGADYQACIVEAIEAAEIVVLLFSAQANSSNEVAKELSLASKKTVVPTRIEDVLPQGAFQYQLSNRQFIDLFEDFENKLNELTARIQVALGKSVEFPKTYRPNTGGSRKKMAMGAALAVIATSSLGYFFVLQNSGSDQISGVASSIAGNSVSSGSAQPVNTNITSPAVIQKEESPIVTVATVPQATSAVSLASQSNQESVSSGQENRLSTDTQAGSSVLADAANDNGADHLQSTLVLLGNSSGWDRARLLKVEANAISQTITPEGVNRLLVGTSGDPRLDGLKTLAPKIQQNLSGADVALMLDSLDGWDRQKGLDIFVRQTLLKSGLSTSDAVVILRGTTGDPRIKAIENLAPLLMSNLSGDDLDKIVGALDGWDRRKAVEPLLRQSKVKAGLTTNEALIILRGTSGDPRIRMIGDIASRLEGNLRGQDIADILDSLQMWDRKRALESISRAGKLSKNLQGADIELIVAGTDGDSRRDILKLLRQ